MTEPVPQSPDTSAASRGAEPVAATVDVIPARASPVAGASTGGREIGGPGGPEPTRYGDWERGGRCIDF